MLLEPAATMVPVHEKRRRARLHLADPTLTAGMRAKALDMLHAADTDLASYVESFDLLVAVTLDVHRARHKAMPTEILTDPRMSGCAALVLGEAETRVAELLADHQDS